MIGRRAFLTGLIAAPAVVPVAASMPIKSWFAGLFKAAAPIKPYNWGNIDYEAYNRITREAIRLFKNTNVFLKEIDGEYNDEFAADNAKISDTLLIRLPDHYRVTA